MADIFVIYAKEDIERVRPLVEILEGRGWSVVWDFHGLHHGETSSELIDKELRTARCVVAVWTQTSVKGRWILEEAAAARDAGTLISVFVEPVEAPHGFRSAEGAWLADWTGDPDDVELQRLRGAIQSRVGATRDLIPVRGLEELDEVSSVVEPDMEESDVFLGASAPAVVPPGGELTIRFAAYVPEMAVEAGDALRAGSRRAVAHPDLARARWKKGLEADVLVRAKHLTIEPPVKRFKWSGTLDTLVFDAEVADDAPETTVVLKYDVVIDDIVVAALRHDLEIRRGADIHETKEVGTTAARTAFASYASGDRDAVLHRVASLRIAAGLDVFQDCLSLRAGQEWKPQLSEEIRRSDLFLLFWSERAATSQWVEWEWRTALGEKEAEALQLHPLEPVKLSLIPKELTHLHFEDPAMIIRDYYAGSATERS